MRSSSAASLFGSQFAESIKSTRILVVGSGGIGCELLKNIVLVGFGNITLLDLDTIDLSNLNRQFLFRKKDVKQSKALIAARTASAFNPSVKIIPLCANIKESRFDANWFASFHLVMSALDNLDARKHINRMCLAAGVPLVESGTEGYFGQVQPILKGETECYECTPKPVQQKTYPFGRKAICFREPSGSQGDRYLTLEPRQLFGEEENEAELDKAEQDGENPNEIAALREEAQEWKRMRTALRSPNASAGKTVFEKAFKKDTEKLLRMDDMWLNRQKPVPLEFDAVAKGAFVLRGVKQILHVPDASTSSANGHSSTSGLRDQRSLTLPESLDLFVSSVERLSARLQAGEDIITFDKDDDDTLDFVTAASNLRSAVYNIPQKNRWDVKEMAGNIIPAIATTNAIIAGLIVLQAVQILRKQIDSLTWPYLTAKPNKPITGSQLPTPNPSCAACADTYIVIRCNPSTVTLSELINAALEHTDLEDDDDTLDPSSVSVFEAGRLLVDPDFEDNLEKTLADLSCGQGKFISIVDEDERWNTLTVAICLLPEDYDAEDSELMLPTDQVRLKRKFKTETLPPVADSMEIDRTALKRKLVDETGVNENEDEPARKKARPNNILPSSSPSKAQQFEEDGLVILEDDVIVLD
ncbi:E1 ubiquitin-activating protein uba2 [Serendipita sp. 399]|nr:E1 ubiquitin-activating protein uba2 [Serendipita sp. 399]